MRAPDTYTFDDLAQLPEEAAPASAPSKTDSWKEAAKAVYEAGKSAYKSYRGSKKGARTSAPASTYYPAPQAPVLDDGWDTQKILLVAGGGLALIGVIYFLTRR